MEYIENEFTDALIDHFEKISIYKNMKPEKFLRALFNVIDSYLKSEVRCDTITGEKLDEFDFIDLLVRMLNNYKAENYEKRDS